MVYAPQTATRAVQPLNAIFIDFECLKTKPPTPVLLGMLSDVGGMQQFQQVVLDDTLKSAAAAARHVTQATVQETAEALVTEADARDCSLVGWSLFDRDVLLNSHIPEPVKEVVQRRYVNALEKARPWKTKIYPAFKIGRADTFAAKNTLDKFAELAAYPHLDVLRNGEPAMWIRHVLAALKRTGHYRQIRKALKQEWRGLLDYNEHDCHALRHVWLKASSELKTWREYEHTTYCFQPATGARVCFKIGSVDKKRDAVLDRAGVSRWAFIAAWNPASNKVTAVENSRRQSELAAELDAASYDWFPGEGTGEDGAWPPEASAFVLGISSREARRLGRKFGQLAIVVGHRSLPARLVRC
jgi:hypothetical protein